MTCIVGVVSDGKVWIGGDSAGVSGWSLQVRADRKVFAVGQMVMGFTSSFRMGQLLAHTFSPPPRRVGQDLFAYMVAEFVPAVRRCFEAGGWAGLKDGNHTGGAFLVGFEGRLFAVQEDFQVGELAADFAAVGCGDQIALGALWASTVDDPEARVRQALAAAEAFSAGVRGPFHVVSTP